MPTKTWNGSSADWYTPGDWSPTGVPGPTDDVVINSGEAELFSGDAAIKVKSISLHGRVSRNSGSWENPVGQRKRFDHRQRLAAASTGPTSRRRRRQQPDDRRDADQQQHQRQRPRHRQHRHHFGRHCDGERGRRADPTAPSLINIEGSASAQATLNVANAAAGFGSGKGVETGTVVLENDALLEFKTGQITTINGELDSRRREAPTSPTPARPPATAR